MEFKINYRLTYNAVNKVTGVLAPQTASTQYHYDRDRRLTQVNLNGTTVEAYGYDANGNRVLTNSSLRQITNQSASYNNGDQLQAAGNQTYSYDANGRLTTKTRITDDGLAITTTYQYSSDGRLLKVTTPNNTIEYRHNAIGNRVAKLVNGQVTEKYLWQNKTTLLAVYDGSGSLKQRFEYTLSHAPTAFTQNGEKYFILTDQVGSPRIITDSSGNIVKEITYDSYGNVIFDSAPEIEIPFGFAGGLHDKDTGLLRFGYRDYDPETGRWTARDPIGFEGGDSNLYGYVMGDPVNLVDPTGLLFGVAAGESYGAAAAQHWANKAIETGNPLYHIPGLLASLWTPCTSENTFSTLTSGGGIGLTLANQLRAASLFGYADLSGVLINLYNNPTQENYAKAMLAITTSSASSSILKDGTDAFRRSVAAGLDGLNNLTEAIVHEK